MLVSLATLAGAAALPFGPFAKDSKPLALDFKVSRDFEPDSKFWNAEHFQKLGLGPLTKRYESALLTNNHNVNYWIDVYLGADNQKISLNLDTGLSDMWVYGPQVLGHPGGTFDPVKSGSTPLDESYYISYVDNSHALGMFWRDDFSLSLDTPLLKDLQFAVVNESEKSGPGVLGLGKKYVDASNYQYDNLPIALKKAGVTSKASYSLFLGSSDSDGEKGTIIFGGIDKNKYEGDLVSYPIADKGGALYLTVASLSVGGVHYNQSTDYWLDSGTSWNLWPQQVFDDTIKALNATPQNDYHVADCNQPADKYLEFNFGKNLIKLSYQDILVKSNGQCLVGAQPSKGTNILGDVFLRKAYVYYDLTDSKISVAQYKDSATSNIVSD